MSLSAANAIAKTALTTAQYQMSVASANIANADTEGYTRKTAASTAVVTSGLASGVSTEKLTSIVDNLLTKQLVSSSSTQGMTEQLESFTDQLQALYGESSSSDDSGTSLASLIDDLTSALDDLTTTPESESLQSIVLSALSELTSGISDLSDGIQSLREDADQGIASAVDTANEKIEAISALNDLIKAANASGQPTADLEDQRAQALLELSAIIDVRWSVSSTGQMSVYTADGSQALVNSTAHTLSFDSTSSISSDQTYPGGLSGITVDGKDITSSISSGSLAALLTMRDTTLVAAQDELDTLASTLITQFNTVANQATTIPAPESVTASRTSSLSDSFSASGTVRIALVDEDGELSSYSDFVLSSYSTIGDLVNAINSTTGLSASLDSSGALVISSDDSDLGVSIGAMTSSVGSGKQDFSSYFGFNDILSGDDASSIAVADGVSELPMARLDSSSSLTAGETVLSSGDTTVADAFSSLLTSNQSFAASGGLSAKTTTFTDYVSAIISDKATQLSNATSKAETATSKYEGLVEAKSSKSGVNLDEETQTLSDLQQLYEAAAQIISISAEMFDALLASVK